VVHPNESKKRFLNAPNNVHGGTTSVQDRGGVHIEELIGIGNELGEDMILHQ